MRVYAPDLTPLGQAPEELPLTSENGHAPTVPFAPGQGGMLIVESTR